MRKSKEKSTQSKASKTAEETPSTGLSLTAPSKAIDPSLASLFGSSLGPVKASERTYIPFVAKRAPTAEEDEDSTTADNQSSGQEADGGSGSSSQDEDVESLQKATGSKETNAPQLSKPNRRAKRKRDDDNIEEQYMQRLQAEEDTEAKKIAKKTNGQLESNSSKATNPSGAVESDAAAEDGSSEEQSDSQSDANENEKEEQNGISKPFPILHEALVSKKSEDLEEAARTVFLGNVPSIAISSKASYKTLKRAFSGPGKIAKLRFRSVAFSEQIPRKAALAAHKLHEKQQTVNAYIVYKTKEAAREALKLNGTVVLDRHIRVDSVAHPAKHDTKRSVFIGNLDFEAQEESLWRHFVSCGKIEYVRIVRDSATNVGKGFAYVQFEDGVSVEQALILDGKKMEGDRKLRITRAKNIKRKDKPNADPATGRPVKKRKVFIPKKDPHLKEMLGRARKLLGKAGAAQMRKAPEAFIFEGTRANKREGKTRAKASVRAAAWKQKNKAKK
ncbi:hypothetical protein BDZ91DRAFT_723028 [Kalaharituber pfeilii]|nr:hypothetical protein BDZ91DRAFT_723028 [Kalaharituber pfeilii]